MKRVLGILGVIAAVLVLAVAALLAAVALTRSPEFAWRLLRYGESDIADARIFPSRTIARSPDPLELPDGPPLELAEITYPYGAGTRTEPLESFIAATGTQALIVIQDDRIVLEAYGAGRDRESMVTSFSTAKAFDSTLIGAAIADGLIGGLSDPVIRYVPELAGRGFDDLTIRDLLLMNTGIRYVHDDEQPFYKSAFGDDALTYYGTDLRAAAMSAEKGPTPVGQAFRYNNYHPLIEGLILERVTGMHVAEYLERRIWQPMGAEYDASWSLDSAASGFEKMESGLNGRAIDFARFGLLFLHGGELNGKRILPADWVREATEPLRPDPRAWETWPWLQDFGTYYKYHWWGLNLPDGGYDFYASGKYSQTIYVAPRKNAVIVRYGDQPDEELRWPLVLRSLVDGLPPPG